MADKHSASQFLVGHGWDLHRLDERGVAGVRALIVGGVELESTLGVVAHSDGDVLYHAVTDALLGAIGEPDIGTLFPDSARENEGRNSREFVIEATRRVHGGGWCVANIDCTVILQHPKLSPVRGEIRGNLSGLLRVGIDAVNVKGKTHEGVDAVGERRAVEAHAVVLLSRGGGSR